MQVLKDNFFYHSNSRLGAEGGAEDGRQVLVEEQRICRSRARKFSLETNRRRKALEERRKQWDVQEQRLRENILQQRRQRVQDATERFQRAHLPPSQRRRQSFRKNGPNIGDALNLIQGSLSSYARQSSFLSSGSTVSRSCSPSPKPPSSSKPSQCRVLSAVEAYTTLLQERGMTCLKSNSQQLFVDKIQDTEEREREQASSPQEHRACRLSRSESLSSLDSLENDNPSRSWLSQERSQSPSSLDSDVGSQSVHRNQNDLWLLPTSSTAMFVADNLTQPQKVRSSPRPKKQEDSEVLNKSRHDLFQATRGFISTEQSPKREAQPPLGRCNLLTLCDTVDADAEPREESSRRNGPDDKITALPNNKVAPGTAELEFSRLKREEQFSDLRQQNVHDDRRAKHPSAREILVPAKNGNKDLFPEVPAGPNVLWNDIKKANASRAETIQPTVKEINCPPSKNKSDNSINNLDKVSHSESKVERSKDTGSLRQACLSNITSDSLKCLKGPEEETQELPRSAGISHSDSNTSDVRFIKGILKKQSKYVSPDTTSMYGSGCLTFAKRVALSIRDSVELTRAKTKDVEGSKCVKKKLRWLDEVNSEEEHKEQIRNLRKQTPMKIKPDGTLQSKSNSEDHQPSLTAVSGAVTPPASTGYHFTKQAWADVGVQVSKLQERGNEVKVPWSSTRTGGPRVPRRERSARVGAGPVSARTRKGTVIRPQSATEVGQIARTQGKIMVPRPPPRTETIEDDDGDRAAYVAKTSYGADYPSVNYKQTLPAEWASHKDNSDSLFSPYTHHVLRRDSGVMYTPLPPSYTCPFPEGIAKGTPSSWGQREFQGCGGRREGLFLDRTPTDEEISQLWHGVRTVLATKEGDPRNFLTHNGPLSVSPQACANLSHVTINGDSLICGVKAVTRTGGFFLSPSNARSLARRQALGGGGSRRKVCVEQSRQPPGSGNRRFPLPSQPTKQAADFFRRFPSTYDLALPDEGPEFQLAEVHGEGMLAERDIMAAMETAQTQRPGGVHQRSQQQGFATISSEEQRILLSLDRLNHQLHCAQEHIGGNPAVRGHGQVDTPSTREGQAATNHKHRTFSVDSRSRNQRRF
ncbi:centrosomal protein of 126 kDa [Polymixia lowei]